MILVHVAVAKNIRNVVDIVHGAGISKKSGKISASWSGKRVKKLTGLYQLVLNARICIKDRCWMVMQFAG
jgi:hypothetical protein